MRTGSLPVVARAACALLVAIVLGACGSESVAPKRPAPPAAPSATTRAAAISLQDAMTSASRAFDAVEPTRPRLSASAPAFSRRSRRPETR